MLPTLSIGRFVTWFSLVALLLGTMVVTYALAPAKEFPSPDDDLCIVPAPTEPGPVATHAGHDAASHQGHHAGPAGQSGRSAHWHDSMTDHCLHCQFRAGRGGPVAHTHVAAGLPLPDIGLPAALFLASAEPTTTRTMPRQAGVRLD